MSNTVQAVRFERPGGPAVLSLREVTLGRPGPGQARIKHAAVGINFIDTQFRAGAKRTALPSGIGVEAAGIVADIGEGVTSIRPGARVTYATGLGAYSTENIVAADALIELPPSIAFDAAAAMTLRGLGAGYLLRRMGSVARGDVIAVHAAAGGLGLILVQWAKLLGLTVIGIVSTIPKARLVRAFGCDHAILTDHEDVSTRVREIAGSTGVRASLGMACTAGSVQHVPASSAIRATQEEFAQFLGNRRERDALAAELFEHVTAGRIQVQISQRYWLREAALAHSDLESRWTTGSSIFVL